MEGIGGHMRYVRFTGILMFLSVFSIGLFAQEDGDKKEEPTFGWNNKVIGTLNLTQTALSNWTTGGENALAWQLNLNGGFNYLQPKYDWSNTLKILYGQSKIGGDELKKTDDEIYFESVFTYKVLNSINPYASVTALTQFTAGYDYTVDPKVKISNFMDPGYFTEAIGMEYKTSETFKTRFGLAMKQTVADDFAALWSDDPETDNEVETLRNEIGFESVTDFEYQLSELIIYVTKLELFSNVKRFDEIDVRWDNLFSAKVAEYISVSLNVKLYYDKDISLKRQLKQSLAVGLTYSFL